MWAKRSPAILWHAALLISILTAQGGAAARQGAGTLRGRVVDEAGALIVNATVVASSPGEKERSAVTDARGEYAFSDLPPGRYTVRARAEGFSPYESAETVIAAGARHTLDIQLSVSLGAEEVNVGAGGSALATDADRNANAIVMRDAELDALPDDPDDLAGALQALAGPSAGPDGGQIFVDGFTSDRVPAKASIREIRLNQNPFSAEYDRPGFSRIEILTRPGTDRLRGQLFFNFTDESLNSRNPFASARAPFQVRRYGGNVGNSALGKRASYFINFERREVDDNANVNATVLDDSLNVVRFDRAFVIPRRNIYFSPRFDWQLHPNHTLVARYDFTRFRAAREGIGLFSLPERSFSVDSVEHTLQLTETAVVNARFVNETRFQYIAEDRVERVASSLPTVNVLEAFIGGGPSIGSSSNPESRVELHNVSTLTRGPHVLRVGARFRYTKIVDISPDNFNGTFIFAGGLAPRLDADNQVVLDPGGQPLLESITSVERYRRTILFERLGLPFAEISARGGGASRFSISTGEAEARVNQADVGLFVQDDWQALPNLNLTFGLRYEKQSNIDNRFNFAPRLGFAYAPRRGSGPGRTVVRGGFGVFYQRFREQYTLEAGLLNGIDQRTFVIDDPLFFDPLPPVQVLEASGFPQTVRRVADDVQAPYTMQVAIGVERQLREGVTVTATYVGTRSLHLPLSRNVNAPVPGTFPPGEPAAGARPFGTPDNVFVYETAGRANQNQLIITANARFARRVSLAATYVLNKASSDTDGALNFPADSYDLRSEYGRSLLDIRHRFLLTGSINVGRGITLSPFVLAFTGRPFNITTGLDTNGDILFTERPSFATDQTSPESLIETPFGRFDINPAPGQEIVPRNLGTGPAYFIASLRASKTYGFGRAAAPNSREKPYSLTLSVLAQNIFNRTNRGVPVGNLSSALFGQSTSTAFSFGFGEGFSASAAGNRRVEAQVRFNF